jgi:hypothetical protein
MKDDREWKHNVVMASGLKAKLNTKTGQWHLFDKKDKSIVAKDTIRAIEDYDREHK